MARRFYRIVKTDPPTRLDFTSNQTLRKPPPQDPELRRLWDGISAYETEDQARRTAARFPRLGQYIAALSIPDSGPLRYERTLRSPGHSTLWGHPADFLLYVLSVIPV